MTFRNLEDRVRAMATKPTNNKQNDDSLEKPKTFNFYFKKTGPGRIRSKAFQTSALPLRQMHWKLD